MNHEFKQEVIRELIRLNPFLQNLTQDDAVIWARLTLCQQFIDDRCVALHVVHSDRRMGAYYKAPDVMERCNNLGAKESRRGDWMHNYYWATQGMSEDDATEIFYARQHHREAVFD